MGIGWQKYFSGSRRQFSGFFSQAKFNGDQRHCSFLDLNHHLQGNRSHVSLGVVWSLQSIPSSENGVSSSASMALCVHAGLDAHELLVFHQWSL